MNDMITLSTALEPMELSMLDFGDLLQLYKKIMDDNEKITRTAKGDTTSIKR